MPTLRLRVLLDIWRGACILSLCAVRPFRRSEDVVAQVIEFYIPTRFKQKVKWVPQGQRGRIIVFRSDLKRSA